MRPTGVTPGEPSAWLPLCCGPNELRNNLRCLLTRWNHLNLRVRKGAVKSWSKKLDCQASNQSDVVRMGELCLRNLELLVGHPHQPKNARQGTLRKLIFIPAGTFQKIDDSIHQRSTERGRFTYEHVRSVPQVCR